MTILKEYRINNELSQEKMAKKLNCSISAYRNYENGKRVIPHDTLINFLNLRAKNEDIRIITVLEEIYGKINNSR